MPVLAVVAVLTALVLAVVVATRVRLARDGSPWSGSHGLAAGVHTLAGAVGVVGWVGYLLTGQLEVGIASLFLLWLAALAGLVVVLAWRPRRHAGPRDGAEEPSSDDRSRGVGGFVAWALAHTATLAAVAWFTWVYLVAAA